jgi:hypothetical protein
MYLYSNTRMENNDGPLVEKSIIEGHLWLRLGDSRYGSCDIALKFAEAEAIAFAITTFIQEQTGQAAESA